MSARPLVLLLEWMPDSMQHRLESDFPEFHFVRGREPVVRDAHLGQAAIAYGLPPLEQLPTAGALRWVQLATAGVPQEFCLLAQRQQLAVTNLAGLYGPTIAEHALALMLLLSR